MSKVKAHIVFDQDQTAHAGGRKIILDKLKKVTKIANINQDRFERYGILTCNVDESILDKVRKISGVAGIEIDEERQLQ